MNHVVEVVAVLLGLSYLLLAVRERRLCWIAGGASSLLFLWLFSVSGLPAQAALQGYYVAVAAHGWWHWGSDTGGESRQPIQRWSRGRHLLALGAVAVLSALTLGLRANADLVAALDVTIGWSSVLATWMVARKVLENWLYWIVIDCAATGLYLHSALPATAGLYVLYTLIAMHGWRQWLRRYQHANAA